MMCVTKRHKSTLGQEHLRELSLQDETNISVIGTEYDLTCPINLSYYSLFYLMQVICRAINTVFVPTLLSSYHCLPLAEIESYAPGPPGSPPETTVRVGATNSSVMS